MKRKKVALSDDITWYRFFMLCSLTILIAGMVVQSVFGLSPCLLCWLQRILLALATFWFSIAWLHRPGVWGQRVYQLVGVVFGLLGVLAAGRQLWLIQQVRTQPAVDFHQCLPDIYIILRYFSWSEMIQHIINGTRCTSLGELWWQPFLPMGTLLFFSMMVWQCACRFIELLRSYAISK